uniref:SFRICE_040750 n=1 Tax=Spodoptera frugiperda TaxID=7108 RepID=A0A2H1WM47_SPOFR
MCRRAPRRSLLLSSVAQPRAAPQRARHSPGARGPQRRRAEHRAPNTVRDCDSARITDSVSVIPAAKVKTGSPISVVQVVARGTRARPRTLPQEACRKRGSGASAGKPLRALHNTHTLDCPGNTGFSSNIVPW